MMPQKILHILSGDLWAGAEVQAYNLLLELNKEHQVIVCLLNAGVLSQRLADNGIKIHIIDESEHSFFSIIKSLTKLFMHYKPDIIHTHRTKENIVGSLANFFSTKARCVRTLHGAPEHTRHLKTKILRVIDAITGKLLQQHLVLVAPQLKQSLIWPLDSMPQSVIYNAVNVDNIQRESLQSIAPITQSNAINVGFFGRFVSLKRIDLILDIAAGATTDIHFHLFGDGPEKPAIKQAINDKKLNNTVHLHGHIDNIYPFIKQMDLLMLLSDHEGLPMILLESLALGKPMITRDIQPFNELKLTKCVSLDENFVDKCLDAIHKTVESGQVSLPEKFTTAYMTQQLSKHVYMVTA